MVEEIYAIYVFDDRRLVMYGKTLYKNKKDADQALMLLKLNNPDTTYRIEVLRLV